MLKRLKVHGFRTLLDTELDFAPLTIMIGKNGVGKTAILEALQLLGNFARGGIDRAFGPPPWSLSWQRTRGVGHISGIRFVVEIEISSQLYRYELNLHERSGDTRVAEERLTRISDNTTLASFSRRRPPSAGTILHPDEETSNANEINAVAMALKSVVSYELNPSVIERGNDPEHNFVSREGRGVAGYLSNLKDNEPRRFEMLERRLKAFRSETESIDIWGGTGKYIGAYETRDKIGRFQPFIYRGATDN